MISSEVDSITVEECSELSHRILQDAFVSKGCCSGMLLLASTSISSIAVRTLCIVI